MYMIIGPSPPPLQYQYLLPLCLPPVGLGACQAAAATLHPQGAPQQLQRAPLQPQRTPLQPQRRVIHFLCVFVVF